MFYLPERFEIISAKTKNWKRSDFYTQKLVKIVYSVKHSGDFLVLLLKN